MTAAIASDPANHLDRSPLNIPFLLDQTGVIVEQADSRAKVVSHGCFRTVRVAALKRVQDQGVFRHRTQASAEERLWR